MLLEAAERDILWGLRGPKPLTDGLVPLLLPRSPVAGVVTERPSGPFCLAYVCVVRLTSCCCSVHHVGVPWHPQHSNSPLQP